jgi:hypothetical protein
MRKGSFDPHDKARVKHSTIGVWDLYEEITPRLALWGWPSFQPLFDIVENVPYVWRMLSDVASIRECNYLLFAYLVIELIMSLLPALSLWCAHFSFGEQRKTDVPTQVFRTAPSHRRCTLSFVGPV